MEHKQIILSPGEPELGRDRAARPVQRGLFAALAVVLVLLYLLRFVLLPFVFAGALAYLLSPAVRWMQRRWNFPRWAAATIAWLVLVALLAGVGVWGRFVLVPQVIELSQRMPQIVHRLAVQASRGEEGHFMGRQISARAISESVSGYSSGGTGDVLGSAATAIAVFVGAIITLVLLLYYLIGSQRLRQGLLWLVPPRHRERAQDIARELDPIMASYIRGLLIVAAYAFTLTFIFARMVIGAGYAPILALAVGGLEILLVIGPTISTIALCVIAVQQESLAMLAAFAIFIAFLRLSIDEFVGPIVIGRAVSLHPVTIMFTLLVGMALLGVLGVLLAVPTAAAIKVFLRHSYGEPSNS